MRTSATQSSTLPAAMATGNLTLMPYQIVSEIIFDKDKKRASGRARDGRDDDEDA